MLGRYAQRSVKHPETGEVLVARNEIITEDIARKIIEAGIEENYNSFSVHNVIQTWCM